MKGREGGPEQRGLGTTLKLFLDQTISGAINLSRCGCRSHARASSARCTPRGRRGGGLVNPIVLVSHYISLIALSGGKSRKLVGISTYLNTLTSDKNDSIGSMFPTTKLPSQVRRDDSHDSFSFHQHCPTSHSTRTGPRILYNLCSISG